MSRLTQCFEVGNYVEKKDICIIPKSLCQVFDDDIVMGKAVDKLSELEDVLEEFGIESVEELKTRLTVNKEFVTQVHKEVMQEQIEEIVKTYYGDIVKENAELKSKLSKAIVPKFEIGQECWCVYNKDQKMPFRCIVDRICYDSAKNHKFRYDTSDNYYICIIEENLFATQTEAQAKLDEIRRK